MNLLPVTIDESGQVIGEKNTVLQIPSAPVPAKFGGRKLFLGLRPEHLLLHAPGIPINIEMVEILGSEQLVHGRHGDTPLVLRCPVSLTREFPLSVGETVQIGHDPSHPPHWFDVQTGVRID
jgi:sn-glycerol 3-phosphate transport system ATP-binding protein